MFVDARKLPDGEQVEADICIVGAGPAGITLAKEFIGKPFRVCLLESGGLYHDELVETLALGTTSGMPYVPLDLARVRYFGGSTNHWDGRSAPLETIDFKKRDWIPYSGWPIGPKDLETYYPRAQSLLELGAYEYDTSYWEEFLGKSKIWKFPLDSDRLRTRVFMLPMDPNSGARFGTLYREDIDRAENVTCFLYANVTELVSSANAGAITGVRVGRLEGGEFTVRAKYFVLATGGIENARMLLMSNKISPAGIGNINDIVGRFFLDHIYLQSGTIIPAFSEIRGTYYYKMHRVTRQGHTVIIWPTLRLADRVQEEIGALNYTAYVVSELEENESPGVLAAKHIYRALRRGRLPPDLRRQALAVAGDLGNVVQAVSRRVGRTVKTVRRFRFINMAEQAPNPESRVVLGNERDQFGNNRAHLDWRLGALDKYSIRRSQEVIGEEFKRAGLGEVEIELSRDDHTWPETQMGRLHHMGATRMSTDAKQGVVDPDCRVHGCGNLFVVGGSVFPTGGAVNPTLTILALALRLADHLRALMKEA